MSSSEEEDRKPAAVEWNHDSGRPPWHSTGQHHHASAPQPQQQQHYRPPPPHAGWYHTKPPQVYNGPFHQHTTEAAPDGIARRPSLSASTQSGGPGGDEEGEETRNKNMMAIVAGRGKQHHQQQQQQQQIHPSSPSQPVVRAVNYNRTGSAGNPNLPDPKQVPNVPALPSRSAMSHRKAAVAPPPPMRAMQAKPIIIHPRDGTEASSSKYKTKNAERAEPPSKNAKPAAPIAAGTKKSPSAPIDRTSSVSAIAQNLLRAGGEMAEKARESEPADKSLSTKTNNITTNNMYKSTDSLASRGANRGRRPGFSARTLEQLQDATKHWYLQALRQQNPKSPPRALDEKSTRMFTLYFNESSVQAVANWANNNRNSNNHNGLIPTVDTRYRLCGTCYLYGHYEMECPFLTREQALRFANDLKMIREREAKVKQPPSLATPMTTASTENAEKEETMTKDDEIYYDVVTECCEGYLIEQRENSEIDITVVDDGVFIQAAASADAFLGCGFRTSNENAPPQVHALRHGDFVAWHFPTEHTPDENPKASTIANNHPAEVCAGIVKDIDLTQNKVMVKVVKTISREQSTENSQFPRHAGPSVDSLVWIPLDAVHFVVDSTSILHVAGSTMLGKRKIDLFDQKSKPAARAIRRRKDGTFVRPAGRTPAGHRWDASRGTWVSSSK